jgi:selenocysteine lyase/cysteine desulfurase
VSIDWSAVREAEFPVTQSWAYFDHAAVSPLPLRSVKRLHAWSADVAANGCVHWPAWAEKLDTLRADVARLIGATADEITFVSGTTQGLGLVAEGFPWREGDNIVTAEEEYPSNLYPWFNLGSRGVSVRVVPSRDGRLWIDDLELAMDDRTRLVAISQVEWSSGFRNNLDVLAEVCRARGVAICVDAIQGLGPLTLDVSRTPIDFLACGGQKWLLGPEGAGFAYIRRDWIERLRPIGVGAHSSTKSYNEPGVHFDLKPSAQRWEGGCFIMPGLQTFAASLSLFLELGPENVSARILDRAERVRELAERAGWSVFGSREPGDLSGIVILEKDGVDPDALVLQLRERGIAISARRGRVRISPHCYNDDEDLSRLEAALANPQGA